MQVEFDFPEVSGVLLRDASVGAIIRFLDSAAGGETMADAVTTPEENFFMVFSEDKLSSEGINLVSVDGALITRRQSNRLVRVHKHRMVGGSLALTGVRLDAVPHGKIVLYGLDVSIFAKMEDEDQRRANLYLVAKGNPTPSGKVILISLSGKKVLVDDDIRVRVYEGARALLEL